jgi:hypothetical protein
MEAAKIHGVDLTLNLHSLARTPAERVREMEAALKSRRSCGEQRLTLIDDRF